MKTIKFQITGETALMLNNPQTVNPVNEYSKLLKPLTSKRTKTDDDQEEISKIKFQASLYRTKDGVYYIPATHFEQSLVSAAKERKLGAKFERNVRIFADCPLEFKDKNKSPEELYNIGTYVDVRAVGIKGVKIVTTRAIFPEWSTSVEVMFDETQVNEKEVRDVMEIAGQRYGVGTYRRLYGRFTAKTKK